MGGEVRSLLCAEPWTHRLGVALESLRRWSTDESPRVSTLSGQGEEGLLTPCPVHFTVADAASMGVRGSKLVLGQESLSGEWVWEVASVNQANTRFPATSAQGHPHGGPGHALDLPSLRMRLQRRESALSPENRLAV